MFGGHGINGEFWRRRETGVGDVHRTPYKLEQCDRVNGKKVFSFLGYGEILVVIKEDLESRPLP
jgi:hypothetical protein